jgi:hypothetical protein
VLIVFRKSILQLLIAAVVPSLTLWVFVPMVLFPAFNVSPGSSVEMLAPLYQQTARYVCEYPDDVTAEERTVIDEMLGYSTIPERYDPLSVDTIKGVTMLEEVEYWPTSEQKIAYLKTYISQGLRHPQVYVKATSTQQSGWFRFDSWGDDGSIYDMGLFLTNAAAASWPSDVPHYEHSALGTEFVTGWTQQVLKPLASLPVINFLFMPMFYFLFVPALALLLLLKTERRYLAALVPVGISVLFLMLSPYGGVHPESFRYIMPFIYTTPLLLGFCLALGKRSAVGSATQK